MGSNVAITSQEIGQIYMQKLQILTEISNNNEKILIHPAQDFFDGKMYYGIIDNEVLKVVNSDGAVLSKPELKKANLSLLHEDLAVSSFPTNLLKQNIKEYDSDLYLIFNELKEHISKYVYFKDERHYDLISIWIMGTYMFKCFEAYPYIHLLAERGSGKTTTLKILEPLCFNGNTSSYSTTPVFYRLVHNQLPTLLLDEAEHFISTDKRAVDSKLLEIIRGGYASTGKTNLTSEDYKKVLTLNTYCPKVFAGIGSIDSVLGDRVITIPMIKASNEDKIEAYISKDKSVVDKVANLKAHLYLMGLKSSNAIFQIYQETLRDKSSHFSLLQNRNRELWSPLFAIATQIEKDNGKGISLVDPLISLAEIDKEYKSGGDENDYTFDSVIKELFTMHGNGAYWSNPNVSYKGDTFVATTGYIYQEFRKKEIIPFNMSKRDLTKLLKARGIAVNKPSSGARRYIFKIDSILDYAKRHNIELDEEDDNNSELAGQHASTYLL